jgi:hypothetical protein
MCYNVFLLGQTWSIDQYVDNVFFLSIGWTLNIYKYLNKGNAKSGVSPRLKMLPGDLDLWPMTLKINRVPDSLKD